MGIPVPLLKLPGYIMSGGIAAICDAGGFALLHHAGAATAAAATISFVAAAVVNFRLSSKFVFKQLPSRRRFVLFLSMAVVGLVVNVGLTLSAIMIFDLPPEIAKVFAIAVTFFVNFLLNVFVVFRVSETT